MSTSAESNPKSQKADVPTTALAELLEFDEDMMRVILTDGRVERPAAVVSCVTPSISRTTGSL